MRTEGRLVRRARPAPRFTPLDIESFVPIADYEVFEGLDEAVAKHNASPFGLAASIFTVTKRPFGASATSCLWVISTQICPHFLAFHCPLEDSASPATVIPVGAVSSDSTVEQALQVARDSFPVSRSMRTFRLPRGLRALNLFLVSWTAAVFVFLYVPIILLIVYSFNTSRLNIQWEGFTFDWYRKPGDDAVLIGSLKNSLIIGGVTTVISVIIGTLGAWMLHRYRFPLRRALNTWSSFHGHS